MKKGQIKKGKLTLQKVQITKLNNLDRIQGGGRTDVLFGQGDDGTIPTWLTLEE
ncbi:hypothetical protein [Aquimarina pacifica]|uniref:hypothetical protein n=1 Tax=Aquimarina pacifica TaxID=1296415 RepID=UPI0004ACC387|nr:hypothetical protein [Aquimarina pacifica]